jgi:hypothetical protein
MDRASQPNGDMTELERRMLEAARSDRVPDALGARMAEGLGVQVGTGALTSGLASGAKLGAPLFAKAGLWGVLTLGLVAAVAGWRAAQPAPRVARTPRASAPTAVQPVAAQPSEPPAAVEAAGQGVPAGAHDELAAPAAPAAIIDDAALRAEVALLDRARNALRDGASKRALRLLDQHGQRFTRARLAPEATALRIEALVKLGSHEQAGSMSQEFASTYPSHPLGDHVARLTARRAAPSRSAPSR